MRHCQIATVLHRLSDSDLGFKGPLTVSTPHYTTPIGGAFLEAGKLHGYANIDINGARQTGFAVPQGTLRRGARCSTAKAFIRDYRERTNLHTVIYAHVTRVIMDDCNRAVAVKFNRRVSGGQCYLPAKQDSSDNFTIL